MGRPARAQANMPPLTLTASIECARSIRAALLLRIPLRQMTATVRRPSIEAIECSRRPSGM